MKKPFREDVFDAITRFYLAKESLDSKLCLGDGREIMVLTPGYIKVIAAEIGSQIITELRKPFKKSLW